MTRWRIRYDCSVDLRSQYSTNANLAARIALHHQCSTNRYGFQRWVFDRLQLRDGMRVLEIGAGTGSLWSENEERLPRIELVVSDFLLAMVRELRSGAATQSRSDGHDDTARLRDRATAPLHRVACALPELPFADDAFDVVIANHMLYHVAERERGLRDIRRVLRRDGTLFAATNGIDHLRELKELMRASGIEGSDVSASFTLENGAEQLRRVFPAVTCEEYEDSLQVTDPGLLFAYIRSIDAQAPDALREVIAARIARDGRLSIAKSTGLFAART
jgi:SAM-dependent methyltransferase